NTSSETTGKAGNNDGNSGSGDSGSGSETGNSNSSESDSGNDSKSNNAGNASTGASGSNASTKSDNRVPAKHSSQLVKTGAEVERVGLISAMIGVLGAAAAFFSRKKNRE
ncbi:LPXTG-motif protein cell wall anchor domain protein, partial [Gardnerella vaginalis]